jgi:hypothetical protein
VAVEWGEYGAVVELFFAEVNGGGEQSPGIVGPVGFELTASIPDVTLDVASCGRERRWQMDAETLIATPAPSAYGAARLCINHRMRFDNQPTN